LKKKLGVPLAFFKNLGQKLFVEFLTFDGWNSLGGTKNDVYRRRLRIASIYCVKNWNLKCTPFSPTSWLRIALSSDPFKIVKLSNTHQF